MRIAIFGDLGGWFAPFLISLAKLGYNSELGTLPNDLIVVQLGDLVHRGPDSEKLVALVDEMLDEFPGQWIQLAGNHEGNHLGGPKFMDFQEKKPYELPTHTEHTLQQWWLDKKMNMAAAIHSQEYGDILATHAGLSYTYYKLLYTENINSVVTTLNSLSPPYAFKPGKMLGEYGPAGVAWAECVSEVYLTWENHLMPFHQVHGHSTSVNWSTGKRTQALAHCQIDKEKRHSIVGMGDKLFFGVDPGLGSVEPWFDVCPLVVHGSVEI